MKKILLYLIILVLFSQSVFSIEECAPKAVDIYIDLVAETRDTQKNSEFQFHYFKETDILWLDKLKVINNGNCTIKAADVYLYIEPQKGYTPTNKHPPNYGKFIIPIQELDSGKTLYLIRNKTSQYYLKVDNETLTRPYSHWGIDLDQIGDWIITSEIKDFEGKETGIRYNFRVNGRDIVWFRVHTLMETSLMQGNELNIQLNSAVLKLTYGLFIYTGLLILLGLFQIFYSPHRKEIEVIISHFENISKFLKRKKSKTKKK